MKFNTKHNIGDTVFYILDNKVQSNKIHVITIAQYEEQEINKLDSQSYIEYQSFGKFKLKENRLFKTKKELLKSL
jgi:hypothetical protein